MRKLSTSRKNKGGRSESRWGKGKIGNVFRWKRTSAGMLQMTFLNHFRHTDWQDFKNKNDRNISLLCFEDDSFRLEQISAADRKTLKTARSARSGHCLHSCQNVWKRPCLFFIPLDSQVCSFKNQVDSDTLNLSTRTIPAGLFRIVTSLQSSCLYKLATEETSLKYPFKKLPN